MIRLGASWKKVLRTAWSVRLAALSGLLSALELIAPYFAFAMCLLPGETNSARGWCGGQAISRNIYTFLSCRRCR